MPHMIVKETCNACGSCEDVCPNKAVSHKGKIYTINPNKCKDCVGSFDSPQCVEVCQSGSCVLQA
jgi:ferredoxin